MATNVTQKDKTLNKIIAWCEQCSKAAQDATAISNRKGHFDTGTWHHGRMTAFHEIEQYCESMLGYSGSMPLEVEHQSEDANEH
jgi:hypothetical protein